MENKIIRVFTHKTSYTPVDDYAFVGLPPLTLPEHKEVHVSCAFSWDKDKAEELAFQWEGRTNKPVKLGGTAYKSPTWDFVPGMYVKRNIIFTTNITASFFYKSCIEEERLYVQLQNGGVCFLLLVRFSYFTS